MNHQVLIDTLKKRPADMGVRVCVQNAGVFATLTTPAAIELLFNSGPKWGLTIRDDGEHYDAFIFCDEGNGIVNVPVDERYTHARVVAMRETAEKYDAMLPSA